MSLSPVLACSGKIGGMTSLPNLDQLNPEQLRAIAAQLMQRVESMDKQIQHYKTVNDKLTHEIAQLKRFKFAKRGEQLSPYQASLLDDLIDADIAAIEAELEALQPAPSPTVARKKLNAQPCARVSTHADPSRTGQHAVHLRLRPHAYLRGCQRETRLHARRVHRGTTHPWQVGLRSMRDTDPGTGSCTDHRQGHPHGRSAGPRDDRQIR